MPNTFNADGSDDGSYQTAQNDEPTHEMVSGLHGRLGTGTREQLKEMAERHGIPLSSQKNNPGGVFLRKLPVKKIG